MDDPIYVKVAVWLRKNPVGASGDHHFEAWCAGARELGLHALLALRQLGVEAWGCDYEPKLYYEVTMPGREPQRIIPKLQQTW